MNYDLLHMIMMFSLFTVMPPFNSTLFISVSKDLVTTLVKGPHT